MTESQSLKTSIAREYRSKNPNVPTLTLARIIYKTKGNELVFTNVEDVRTCLRHIEGKTGERNRKAVKDKSLFISEPRPYNPFSLPDSDETKYDKFIVDSNEVLGLLGDVHVPYHSISALTAAIGRLKEEKITTLILAGDFFDFHGLSRFVRDPRKRSISQELDAGCELLKILRTELNCKIIILEGNHEIRLLHYLWQKVGEIHELADLQEIKELNLESLLRKRLDFDFTVVSEKRIMNYRGLNILHGHELPSSIMSPVNIARGLYLRAKAPSICFHHHRSSEHTEQTINSEMITTFSVGCMCELHPNYMPINSHNHGFCIIRPIEDEGYHVINLRIKNGKIY